MSRAEFEYIKLMKIADSPVGDMFNLYQYNSRSEVVDAVRYFGSNTNDTTNPVGLQDWSYSYDNIGNRSGTMKANAAANYTANALNQYTERTIHGSSDIIGSAEHVKVICGKQVGKGVRQIC